MALSCGSRAAAAADAAAPPPRQLRARFAFRPFLCEWQSLTWGVRAGDGAVERRGAVFDKGIYLILWTQLSSFAVYHEASGLLNRLSCGAASLTSLRCC